MRTPTFALILLLSQPESGIANAAPPQRPFLTLELAETATKACRTLAEAKGWRLAIAVLDSGETPSHFPAWTGRVSSRSMWQC